MSLLGVGSAREVRTETCPRVSARTVRETLSQCVPVSVTTCSNLHVHELMAMRDVADA